MIERHLILVEWEDSTQPLSNWRFLEDAPKLEVIQCVSVGWVVSENERVLMLAPNIGDVESSEGPQGSGFIRIPKATITRTAYLQETTISSFEDLSSHPDPTQTPQAS
jgi:hypothetical protein